MITGAYGLLPRIKKLIGLSEKEKEKYITQYTANKVATLLDEEKQLFLRGAAVSSSDVTHLCSPPTKKHAGAGSVYPSSDFRTTGRILLPVNGQETKGFRVDYCQDAPGTIRPDTTPCNCLNLYSCALVLYRASRFVDLFPLDFERNTMLSGWQV